MTIPDFITNLASRPNTTWSISTVGAIAEFNFSHDEQNDITINNDDLTIRTPRGAMRFSSPRKVHIIAYEELSKIHNIWSQGISLCLPKLDALINSNKVITEVGPDLKAIQDVNSNHTLFDIGVGAPHMRAMIRTQNDDLISVLRKEEGTRLFCDDNSALNKILQVSPDRVFESRLGRIEVATQIMREDGETELGPHTHVLADLLSLRQPYSTDIPIPKGYFPCLNAFPQNPICNVNRKERTFHLEIHKDFQKILAEHGSYAANRVKREVTKHITDGNKPEMMPLPSNKLELTALRVAIRQLYYVQGNSDILKIWRKTYDPHVSYELD